MGRADIMSNIENDADAAENLVSAQIGRAQQWASEMFAQVLSFLDQMAADPTFTVPDLILDTELPTDITFDPFDGNPPDELVLTYTKPEPPVVILSPLDGIFTFAETDYSSLLSSDLLEKIRDDLEAGGTGLSPAVEYALQQRFLERRNLEDLAMYDEAENYFAQRGWTIPPGMLSGRLLEIQKEIARANSILVNDMLIMQGELAQKNTHFIIESGVTFEGIMRDFFVRDRARAMELAKMRADALVAEYETKVARFNLLIEKYKADLQGMIAVIEAQVRAYLGEVEAYRSQAEAYGAVVRANAAGYEAIADVARAEADIKMAKINAEVQVFLGITGLEIETARGGAAVAAQVAAGAMSAINAGVSFGYSGSQRAGVSYSDDVSDSTATSQQEILHRYQ